MTYAIRIHRFGGPDVMQFEAIDVGFDAVYDAVGQDTFVRSLQALRPGPGGQILSLGRSSGPVPPLDIARLQQMGREWFEVLSSGRVKVSVNQVYPLKDAARAHADVEGRRTTGSTVLTM